MSRKVKLMSDWTSFSPTIRGDDKFFENSEGHLEECPDEEYIRSNHYIPIHYLSDPSIMEKFSDFVLLFDKD